LILFILPPAGAAAQGLGGRGAFSPQAGVVFPTGDFSQNEMPENAANVAAGFGEMSIAIGASLEYYFSDRFSLGGTVCYNRFGLDTRLFEQYSPGPDSKGHYSVMAFGAFSRLVFLPYKRWRPYARAGGIFGRLRGEGTMSLFDPNIGITLDKEFEFDTDMALGGEIDIGIMHMISSTNALFGEIGYAFLKTDGERMNLSIPNIVAGYADLGFNAQWFGVRFGLSYFFGK